MRVLGNWKLLILLIIELKMTCRTTASLLTKGVLANISDVDTGSNRQTLGSMTADNLVRCIVSCFNADLCSGFNVQEESNGQVQCEFKRGHHLVTDLTVMPGYKYVDVPPTARSCGELYTHYGMNTSGVYEINLMLSNESQSRKVNVYCDMETDGGKWMVLLRRKDGSVSFDRRWDDYLNQFGDLEGEFWMGLDFMHNVTMNTGISYQLRIDMTSYPRLVDGQYTGPIEHGFAKYAYFSVGSPSSFYSLNVSGFTGDWGDSLTYHSGMMFSANGTQHDHDTASLNCAEYFLGPWWNRACHFSLLTGLYGIDVPDYVESDLTYHRGILWSTHLGFTERLQFVEMKIRPA